MRVFHSRHRCIDDVENYGGQWEHDACHDCCDDAAILFARHQNAEGRGKRQYEDVVEKERGLTILHYEETFLNLAAWRSILLDVDADLIGSFDRHTILHGRFECPGFHGTADYLVDLGISGRCHFDGKRPILSYSESNYNSLL